MATSGSTDWTTTEAKLIKAALSKIGVVDPEQSIDAADYADAREQLNMLSQVLATIADLWVTTDVTKTLTPGQPVYLVREGEVGEGVYAINTPRPLRLKAARRSDGTTQLPIEVVGRKRYMDLPNKTTQGPPLLVHYDPQLTMGRLYVWQTGNTTWNTLILTFQRPIEDFDAAGNNPDYPKEWSLCLVYNLARVLAPGFVGGVPPDVDKMADTLLAALKAHDAEDEPIQFVPEW